ncbi:hypothetical protein GGR00_003581 [Aminobacter aganoensis]|uniref:Uncharacterized protein n=1 Tax=Aminobacter aganoensis TaxID=83264 RepID=A0A7X0F9U1_9HYPH|nr:hypothetical protein [Aminobacter aganoensis]
MLDTRVDLSNQDTNRASRQERTSLQAIAGIAVLAGSFLVLTRAQVVVRQRLQNIAILDMITVAPSRYTLEFLFEWPELRNLITHNFELSDRDLIRVGTWTFGMST